MKKFLKMIAAILFCQLIGLFGALFTGPAIPTWYQALNKPAWTPPDWLFAPVWTLLYLLMGISLFLIWESPKKANKKTALTIFFFQLTLNALWSFFFFGLKNPGLALLEIIFLWLTIGVMLAYLTKISIKASLLQLPYLFWVSFAAFLNWTVYRLN